MTIEDPKAVEKSIFRYLDAYGAGGGGAPFGRRFDWPTLYCLFPRIACVLREAQRLQIEVTT